VATPKPKPEARPWLGAINELALIQAEADDDLTAGRISPEVYRDVCDRITKALAAATEPVPEAEGRKIRAVGLPVKEIDTQKLAMVYWMQASRLAREKREKEAGIVPPSGETPPRPETT
jgi:hypothetical protein